MKEDVSISFAVSGVKGYNLLKSSTLNRDVNIRKVFIYEKNNILYENFKHLCEDKNISWYETQHIEEYLKILKDEKSDLLIVSGWGYKIPKEVFTVAKKGVVVLHDSLLPKNRGFCPSFWALLNGEKTTGVTAFFIDEGIDSGDIIFQEKTKISIDDDINSLTEKIIGLYDRVLSKIIACLKQGIDLPRTRQRESEATYCHRRCPEDALIDWNKRVVDIINLLKVSKKPYFEAYTFYKGKKLFVIEAEESAQSNSKDSLPGSILLSGVDRGVSVSAKDGVVKLKKIRFEGEKIKNAYDLVSTGDCLGV
ncbi:MAG: formyltransferase family protein [Candidatus Omnitrophota bacterium]